MSRVITMATVAGLLWCGVPASAQVPNVVTRESVVTATVDRIERGTRVITVRGDDGRQLAVYVDPAVTAFDDLQVGDAVTMRYTESVIVQVKPNAPLAESRETTEEAKKAGHASVTAQHKAVVRIESIDAQNQQVTYRTAGGLTAIHGVADKRLLEGLHAGDRVEVTLTRERAVSIERRR